MTSLLAYIIAFYLLAIFALSLYAGRRVKSEEDYIVAGRRLPLSLAWATLLATWFGAATILGAEAIGLGRDLGLSVRSDLSAATKEARPDVAVQATCSRIEEAWPEIAVLLRHGVSVVSIAEEMAYPAWGAPAISSTGGLRRFSSSAGRRMRSRRCAWPAAWHLTARSGTAPWRACWPAHRRPMPRRRPSSPRHPAR